MGMTRNTRQAQFCVELRGLQHNYRSLFLQRLLTSSIDILAMTVHVCVNLTFHTKGIMRKVRCTHKATPSATTLSKHIHVQSSSVWLAISGFWCSRLPGNVMMPHLYMIMARDVSQGWSWWMKNIIQRSNHGDITTELIPSSFTWNSDASSFYLILLVQSSHKHNSFVNNVVDSSFCPQYLRWDQIINNLGK